MQKFLQMLKKGTKLYSILTGTCPKCQEESMYMDQNPYKLSTIYKMHEKCSHCGLQYQLEPSFFYGAMYVSYAINVAIMVAVWVGSEILYNGDVNIWWLVLISIVVGLILTPINFRWARLIWINIFVKYKPLKKVRES